MANWMPPQFPMPPHAGLGPLRPPADAEPPDQGDEGMENLSEEELERLAELGVVDDEMAANILRQRQAQEAASIAPPEGRQAGRVYVAANPLEHVAAAGSRIGALRRSSKLTEEQKGILDKKRKGYKQRFATGFEAYGFPKPFTFGDEGEE